LHASNRDVEVISAAAAASSVVAAEPCPQTRQGSPGVRAWHKAQTSSLFLVAPPRALASPGAMPRIEAMGPTADLTLPIESRSS
jgi:hypothetical protein